MKRGTTSKPLTPKTPSVQSSILTFFNRTPTTSTSLVTPVQQPGTTTSPNENVPLDRKRSAIQIDDDSPPPKSTPKPSVKRRKVVIESDEEMEIVEEKKSTTQTTTPRPSGSSTRHRIVLEDDSGSNGFDFDDDKPKSSKKSAATPKSRKSKTGTPVLKRTSTVPIATPGKEDIKKTFEQFANEQDTEPQIISQQKGTKRKEKVEEYVDENRHKHETFDHLKPEKIRDAAKRRPDDPDYDPKTLYVPPDFMKSQTPGHRQWWEFKSKYFDTVVFFKVGKFYEMYHMDAVIGINNLDLTAMRGNYCHCGFPEIAYGKYSDMLVARGYKVARVEQTETPAMRDARGEKDKVVRREICRITTTSTKTFGVYDGSDDKNFFLSIEPTANYFMAVVEEQKSQKISSYGLCFIDTSVGTFIMAQFEDDICRSTLRTVTANFQPCHIIFPKGSLSSGTQSVLNSALSAVKKEPLFNKREFYTEDKVVSELMTAKYLGHDVDAWPKELESVFDITLQVPRALPGKELCVRALGGLMFYLQRCLIDVDMFSMKNFVTYRPPNLSKGGDEREATMPKGVDRWKGKNLVLDGATLLNLHLVPPFTGKKVSAGLRDATALKFSLFSTVDSCKTPFGKRLLRMWICSPSCDPTIINERQDAIEYLMRNDVEILIKKMEEYLKKLPDLERLLQKIHTLGLKYRSQEHPDGRAQMFFKDNYNKRKINDLITTLSGFERIQKLHKAYSQFIVDDKCPLVERCIGSEFTDIREDLTHFEKAFDREKAAKDGEICPRRGVVKEYDVALRKVEQCEAVIQEYLNQKKKEFKCQQMTLIGKDKNRYSIEVPDNVASKLPKEFKFASQRKGFKRYSTDELNELCKKLFAAENERDEISADVTRRVFADFADRNDKWSKVVSQIAVLDCIASLAYYALRCKYLGFPVTRPQFDFDSDEPYVEIRKGYHPLLISGNAKLAKSASKFIPNDTVFGKASDEASEPLCYLLTGPNMAGKSTLMRQVAVLIVFAQMGALVPASFIKLTPADRIFSRIGAHDSSLAGQSTFYVELNETNSIIKNATKDSFVVIDELGRGTSTNDGTAIAGAVLQELADSLKCRTFFSTHYFALCDLVENNENVKLAHMNFIVENENADDPTEEDIIFLYKLVDGLCKKSYGFFAAKLAGIPNTIVKDAAAAGHFLEDQQKKIREDQVKNIVWYRKLQELFKLRQLCSTDVNVEEIAQLIEAL